MSNQQSSYTSYTSTSFSSSSTSGNAPQTKSYSEHATFDSQNGGSVTRESRESGQPTLTETRQIPAQSSIGSGTSSSVNNRQIEDVSDKDQAYLEAMEEEYAKREGGA